MKYLQLNIFTSIYSTEPKTLPEFPQNDENPKNFDANAKLQPWYNMQKDLTRIDRKKVQGLFRGRKLLVLAL